MARYEKTCKRCGKTKTVDDASISKSEFHRSYRGGPCATCKSCQHARKKDISLGVARRVVARDVCKHMTEEIDTSCSPRYKKRSVNSATAYIRYCPDGTWPDDVYFNGREFHAMLKDGYLTAGMLVQIAEIEYIILGKQLEPQWMIPA